jgi:hypothetical protein
MPNHSRLCATFRYSRRRIAFRRMAPRGRISRSHPVSLDEFEKFPRWTVRTDPAGTTDCEIHAIAILTTIGLTLFAPGNTPPAALPFRVDRDSERGAAGSVKRVIALYAPMRLAGFAPLAAVIPRGTRRQSEEAARSGPQKVDGRWPDSPSTGNHSDYRPLRCVIDGQQSLRGGACGNPGRDNRGNDARENSTPEGTI